MAEVTITKLKCERCGHTWVPRKSEITICPKCKSPYWNRPRQVKETQK